MEVAGNDVGVGTLVHGQETLYRFSKAITD